jgi:type I restriction enzyme S subunit
MEVLQDTYKDTKIGRIPKDWQVMKLVDLIKLSSGKGLSKKNMIDGNIPVYGGNGISGYHNDYFIEEPTIVIGRVGEYCGSIHLLNENCWITDNGLYVTKFLSEVNLGFLAPLFQIMNFNSYSKVGGQPSISQTTVTNLSIPFPSLPEQHKIAAILSTVDEQISTTDKIIDKSKELKKGLMQKLFSEGIGHTEFKDTKIGRIPKDWEVVRLEEVTSVCSSKRVHRSDYVADGIPFYRSKEIILKSKGLKIKSELYISKEHFDKLKDKYNIPKKGEILITAVGSLGIPYLIKDEEFYFKDGNLIWFRDISININPNYFLYCLNSPKIQNTIKVISGGSSQSALTMVKLNKMRILLPNIEEQQKIAAILSEVDAKIEKEQTQKAHLKVLKKGLMQQLLTGKKRVKV